MSEIQVRALEASDVQAMHEIFNCPSVVAGTLQVPYRSFETTRERFGETPRDSYRLVAVIDGRVVGNLGLDLEPSPRRRDVASMGMAVHDDFQNRGVGSALIAAMVELADNWIGLRRIELQVWTDNQPAVHLYEKFGFVIEGTAQQFARRAGEYVDAYYMARMRTTKY